MADVAAIRKAMAEASARKEPWPHQVLEIAPEGLEAIELLREAVEGGIPAASWFIDARALIARVQEKQ